MTEDLIQPKEVCDRCGGEGWVVATMDDFCDREDPVIKCKCPKCNGNSPKQ